MWSLRTWAAASNERAIANARTATTACSRRRVEREEVALFLAAHGEPTAPSGHPGWAADRSH
ncbi:hypothetical protein [Nocardioides litoris]|uniref:hypothetical protein n=1 Tax=Nocardioides litoris TaxID=1926648 RepID=UPI00111FEEFC|nr:hypothetical protein [Nocardioides litoris]